MPLDLVKNMHQGISVLANFFMNNTILLVFLKPQNTFFLDHCKFLHMGVTQLFF